MTAQERVFRLKSDLFKSLAHPLRLALIELLKNGEHSVGELASALKADQSTISKGLRILKHGGMLSSRQEGTTVYYAIRDQNIFKILRVVSDILATKVKESATVLAQLGKR
jgi:ArsR family transcriptional regulator